MSQKNTETQTLYTCRYCSRTFTTQGGVASHEFRKHDETTCNAVLHVNESEHVRCQKSRTHKTYHKAVFQRTGTGISVYEVTYIW